MAEAYPTDLAPLDDATAQAVVALADRYLAHVGLPSYSALADARIEEIQRAAQLLATDGQRMVAAEMLRLRVAHGVVASEIRSAQAALERQDIFGADNLLTEALATASVSARPHGAPIVYPPNVVPLGPVRLARRARDFGGL